MSYGIGDKISKLRRAKNITQSQLAQYLYITPQTVSKWESGNGIPDIALLPKIAIFFDVSLDYLFDIADKQRIEDVILKYSVMRDDYSYGVALSMIESVLADETLKEADKAEYHALKGHLYLQKARDYISKSVTVTEKAMTYTDQNNRRSLSLQLYLLRIMNGEYKNVMEEVEEAYKSNKDCQSLFVYMEVLSMIQDYKTMMELIENDDIAKSIIDNKEVSARIMIQYLQALVYMNEEEKAEHLFEELPTCISGQDQLDALLLMAKLYSYNGDSKLDRIKERAIKLLESMDYNQYLKTEFRNQINAL